MQLLETKTTQYKISLKGYHSRTPAILKYIADFVIFALMPAVDAIILQVDSIFPDNKGVIMFWWGLGCVMFKLITKFIEGFPKPDNEITGETVLGQNTDI